MEVIEAIKTRRSIRRYKPTPVKEEDLEAVLEAARWAPSWKNSQCWRFIIVRDSEIKARLAETLAPGNPSASAIRNAPIVIAACAELGKAGYKEGKVETEKGDWHMFDVALAMQNLMLAAHSLGLGTVHVGWLDHIKAAEVLGLPEGVTLVELTPLGYSDEQPKAPPRKELAELVFYERYGQKCPSYSSPL